MTQRRVLLVDLYWTRDKDPRVPLGHASILAALRGVAGVNVTSHVFAVNGGPRAGEIVGELLSECAGLAPGDVDLAFGAYVWGEELLQQVLSGLRAAGYEGRIILGGPQISYSGPGLETLYPCADAFVRGYGEQALAELVRSGERRPVCGVHWAGEPDLKLQAKAELASLASPWLEGLIPLKGRRFVRWETQRGCPFSCSFCQHREAGGRLKSLSLDWPRVFDEIELFCESGVQEISVLDPVFNDARGGGQRVLERLVERGYTGSLSLQCRAEMITPEFLAVASQLDVCLEFGLQTVDRQESMAIGRGNNIRRVDQALERVRALGIRHEVSLIFGLPLQTLASFEGSVAWCLERAVPVLKAFPLLLLRGTKLDSGRARWGLQASAGSMPVVLSSSSFDQGEWLQMARISQALLKTQGDHPQLPELKQLAATLEPEILRWIPGPSEASAAL